MMEFRGITIIGPGAVGTSLLDFFLSSHYQVQSVWDRRSIIHYENGKPGRIKERKGNVIDENDLGTTLFLTVPDDQIRRLSEHLAEQSVQWNERVVIHCSGNLLSGECESLQKKGAVVASMHPIQTFTRGDRAERLKNIYVSLQGDGDLIEQLSGLVQEMGSKPVILQPNQKRNLHLAAVIACNYLVVLLSQSEQLLKDSGIKDELNVLKPLIVQTLENLFSKGVEKSLTGPISRGDTGSVLKHMELIENNPSLMLLYKAMGNIALKITKEHLNLDAESIAEMESVLEIK